MTNTRQPQEDILREKEELRPTEATIDFSKDKTYRKFKLAYHAALGAKRHPEIFVFDNLDVYLGYAKYLLQYVEGERKRRKLKYFDPVKRQWKANYPKGD